MDTSYLSSARPGETRRGVTAPTKSRDMARGCHSSTRGRTDGSVRVLVARDDGLVRMRGQRFGGRFPRDNCRSDLLRMDASAADCLEDLDHLRVVEVGHEADGRVIGVAAMIVAGIALAVPAPEVEALVASDR